MSRSTNPRAQSVPTAVMLTALPEEYAAVSGHLTDLKLAPHPKGNQYEVGSFTVPNGPTWNVAIAQIDQGNSSAAAAAERMIDHFEPELAFFVGVAGGLKDVVIGDVVAATKIYGYERGKAKAEFQTRPDVYPASFELEEAALAESRRLDWLAHIRLAALPPATPRVFVGPIAAGEKVIASNRSDAYKFLKRNFTDALAVEMEGIGFLSALRNSPDVKGIVIRGISDLILDKQKTDSQGSQGLAARNAAAFAFEILARFDPPPAVVRSSPWTAQEFQRVAFAIGRNRSGGICGVLEEVADLEQLRLMPFADGRSVIRLLGEHPSVGSDVCLLLLCEDYVSQLEPPLESLKNLRPDARAIVYVSDLEDGGAQAMTCLRLDAAAYLVNNRHDRGHCLHQVRSVCRGEPVHPLTPIGLDAGANLLIAAPLAPDVSRSDLQDGVLPAVRAIGAVGTILSPGLDIDSAMDAADIVLANVSPYARKPDRRVVEVAKVARDLRKAVLLLRRSEPGPLPPELLGLPLLEYCGRADLAVQLYFTLKRS